MAHLHWSEDPLLIDTEPKELNKWATANNLLENNQREKIFTDNNQFQLYSIMIRKQDFISGERLLQSFPYLLLDPECVEKLRKKTLILAETNY